MFCTVIKKDFMIFPLFAPEDNFFHTEKSKKASDAVKRIT
jgi:hypothetical protein